MSNQHDRLADLIIRPATAADTGKVFTFLEDVWDGEDYLSQVWDEWLGDESGRLVVAELDSEPIGTGRIVNLGWNEYWLEGLRVACEHRGKGVAQRIQNYLLDCWEQSSGTSVGYLTHRDQIAVHKLSRAGQFHHIFNVHMMRWEAQEGQHDFQRCEDHVWAAHMLASWSHENGLKGRMETEWRYPRIIPGRLTAGYKLWTWRAGQGVIAFEADEGQDEKIAALVAASFALSDAQDFFIDLSRLCSMLELGGGRWFAPSLLLPRLVKANIEPVKDLEMAAYLKYR